MISKELFDDLTDFLDYELDVCGCIKFDKWFLARFGLNTLTYKDMRELCELLAKEGYHVCADTLLGYICFVSKHQLSKWEESCSTCNHNDKGCVESCRDRHLIMRCKYCTHDICPFNSPKFTVIQ